MKLSVFSPVFGDMPLDAALKYLADRGVDGMELGAGGYPGKAHADIIELKNNAKKRDELKALFDKHGIEIAALSVHGNPVHPQKNIAKTADEELDAAIEVAPKLGVKNIITFSGCPGDGKGDMPNWVTCAWPNEFADVLKYQWNDVLVPYWTKKAKLAADNGVRICFEMHPGFCVYNPETLLKLRAAAGDSLGANFDPSHLLWQGIDPVAAIKKLGNALYWFHAKDTAIDKYNIAVNGVLDVKPYSDEAGRSWIFRTVGYGSDEKLWKDMVSALRTVGYDGYLSIEHEDSLMTQTEGLDKAIEFMKNVIIRAPRTNALWWV